jgi:hypothetical protein
VKPAAGYVRPWPKRAFVQAACWIVTVLICARAGRGAAQSPDARRDLTLDHFFVFVPPGAGAARQALTDAGINVGTAVARHDGAGTASCFAMFENAYLELAWVDSSVSSEPQFRSRLQRNQRASVAAVSGPSPFGVGLRRTTEAPTAPPYISRPATAPWMKPGSQIDVLAPPADTFPSPRVFVVPPSMADWKSKVPPSQLLHRLGVRRITHVRVLTPPGSHLQFLGPAITLPDVTFEPGSEHLAELTFDGGSQHRRVDLRPRVPLVLLY